MFDDLKIVEFGQGVSAAYCAKLFADLGADAIKVEPPAGDALRRRGPFAGDEPGVERSGLFAYVNTSKRGVTLDVSRPQGRQIFLDLVRRADILIENNPPARMAELALDYKHLRAVNPALIMTSVTPFGQDGPWRDYLANEFIVQHASGVAYNNGAKAKDLEAEPPIALPGQLGEFLGGLAAASATMCALWGREVTGQGAHVDVAVQEALAMHLQLDMGWVTYARQPTSRSVGAQPAVPYLGQQPAADGYVDFVVRTERQWRNLLEVLGQPEWSANELFATMQSRAQYWDALEPLVQEETRRFPKERLFRESQANGVPAAPVHTIADAARAEHFTDRGAFVEFEHPVIGRVRCPGAPVRFAGDPWRVRRAAPLLGEHNRAVFCDRLGYSDEKLRALRETGVV